MNSWLIGRAVQQTFLELPADAILLDLGRALLAALCETGAVSPELDDECVRVVEMPGGSYEVFVADASPEDSFTFSRAYQQMLGPLADARYLIERDSTHPAQPDLPPPVATGTQSTPVGGRPQGLPPRTRRIGHPPRAGRKPVPPLAKVRRRRAPDLYPYRRRAAHLAPGQGAEAPAIRQTAFEIWH